VKNIISIFGLLATVMAHGQADTVLLEPVTVAGFGFTAFATGAPVEEIKINNEGGSLDELLGQRAALYFKTYGNQQLATISFRGTSASHTNVLWHGIPVNSPTLGQTDFSQWPAWLMDDVGVQAGSAGALYGSGSIGGTVFIDHFNHEIDPFSVTIGSRIGSFGESFFGLKTTYGKGKLRGATKLFRNFIQNDFSYPLKGKDQRQVQNNAAVLGYGAKQQLQLTSGSQRFSADFMFTNQDREVQPPITNTTSEDELQTKNLRIAFEYLVDTRIGSFTTTLGLIQDHMIYNSNQPIVTNQYTLLHKYEQHLRSNLSILGGVLLNSSSATSSNFQENVQQQQADAFGTAKYLILDKWKVSLGLRQSFISAGNASFLPTLGTEVSWGAKQRSFLASAKIARGYRYPTLNDLFWNPGGNPDLKPEKSMNAEMAVQYLLAGFATKATAYWMDVDDWIIWTPGEGGIWSPDNLQQVMILGLEYEIEYKYSWSEKAMSSLLKANSQQSVNQSSFPSLELKGNQLPYVPYITGVWINSLQLNQWELTVDQSYIGSRFTTLDNSELQSVSGYYLLDASVGYNSSLDMLQMSVTLSIKNILDTYYENLKNRAMPGINYQLQLLLSI
jgi:iron complex outermembrane receptor protein